jgi:hypothetical protein
MASIFDRRYIAGTAGSTDFESMPEAWKDRIGFDPVPSSGAETLPSDVGTLEGVVSVFDTIYSVEERSVAFQNEESNQWQSTNRGIALVNPRREAMEDPDYSPVWHIPTSRYTPATPAGLYDPLVEAIGDDVSVFGQARCYRAGGEIHFDVFLGNHRYEVGDTEFVFGLTTGHDYFGGKAHKASVIALDCDTGSVLRDLTDPRKRKHTGESATTVSEWWASVIGNMSDVAGALRETVAEAQAYEIDISALPIDAQGFFAKLGLPEGRGSGGYLAAAAGDRSGLDSGPQSAYRLYKAGVEGLEAEFDDKTGGDAFMKHLQNINRLLFAPPIAEASVVRGCVDDVPGRESIEGSEAAELADRADTVSEGVEYFETKRDKLRAMLSGLDDPNDESDEDEPADEPTDEAGDEASETDGRTDGLDSPESRSGSDEGNESDAPTDGGHGEESVPNENESDDADNAGEETATADGGFEWVDDR